MPCGILKSWKRNGYLPALNKSVMNKRGLYLLFLIGTSLLSCQKKQPEVVISTSFGDIRVRLFDTTPRHRDNFLQLVRTGFYDSLLFHRVIRDYIIQGGDPGSKHAPPGVLLGEGDPGYDIPAEIGAPHLRGAVSAARLPDARNPYRRSSGSQFFIVLGEPQTDAILDKCEKHMEMKYSPELREQYKKTGGIPQLDAEYTVFGAVISGLEVLDKIAAVPRDNNDRPLEDIRMTIKTE